MQGAPALADWSAERPMKMIYRFAIAFDATLFDATADPLPATPGIKMLVAAWR
jgi:hypothetical protein